MNDNESTRGQRRLIYSGCVQGVGFRYTAASIARQFRVTGFVRNLADGTVELVVDGAAGEVERFLKEVDAAFAGDITGCDPQPVDPPQEFRTFEIRH